MGKVVLAALAAIALAAAPAAAATRDERGAWEPADKDGFGTARERQSKVWYTLGDGRLAEVYYPTLGSPSVRKLEFVVSDGRGFTEYEHRSTRRRVELTDPRSLGYRQVNTDRQGRYRITKSYTTDPARNALLIRVRFEVLRGGPLRLLAEYDPALMNDPQDDRARGAIAYDRRGASALLARPALPRVRSGLRRKDGGVRLMPAAALRRVQRAAGTRKGGGPADLVQVARTSLTGRPGRRELTLALGFARKPAAARAVARASLRAGFERTSTAYAAGWHGYLDSLPAAPAAAAPHRGLYDVSVMTLAALEDKTYRGASVASPSMPWAWGDGRTEDPSGPYHLVWPRDLYQVATAQIAAGDRAGAERLLDFLFARAQKRDGSFPQNAEVNGKEHWDSLQLDEVALPIVLAWQLGRVDSTAWTDHVQPAAEFILRKGPQTEQERWENQSGWSPGTIASEIAGLICAADIARRNGDAASAARYERTADAWQARVERWTATSNGPYGPKPYYLRITKKGNPNQGTRYGIGDTGPKRVDQRRVVDPSFLELVRLGVKRFDDPVIRNSLAVVDRRLAADLPGGRLWRRFSFDGYGETRAGAPWTIEDPKAKDQPRTLGRAWPIFAGERGEYELLAGQRTAAEARLATMAAAAGQGLMLPEQVWDGRVPTGKPGFRSGKGTFSATPLAWTHAQFIRLAWSLDAGRPVERPSVVACRYAGC